MVVRTPQLYIGGEGWGKADGLIESHLYGAARLTFYL